MDGIPIDPNLRPANLTGKFIVMPTEIRMNLKGGDLDSAIFSIRAKNLYFSKERPQLGWFDKISWVPVKLSDGNYVILNINSLAKHTGLSKEEINKLASNDTLSAVLDKQLLQAKQTMQTALANAVINDVVVRTKRKSTDVPVRLQNDKTIYFTDPARLARLANVDEEEIWKASALGRLTVSDLGNAQKEGVYNKASVRVSLEAPHHLQDLVRKVVQLRSAICSNPPSSQFEGRPVLLSHQLGLTGYLSPRGELAIKQFEKELGQGAFKIVVGGININGEELAISIVVAREGREWLDISLAKDEATKMHHLRGEGLVELHYVVPLTILPSGEIPPNTSIGIITKLYNGGTLRDQLANIALLPADERISTIAFIMKKLAAGLQRMHSEQLIHRDIKPDNILISIDNRDGRYAVKDAVHTDYGYMGKKDKVGEGVVGTRGYLAPELVRTNKASASNDLYAMGRILFDLLWLHERMNFDKRDPPGKDAKPLEHVLYDLKCLYDDLSLPAKGHEKPSEKVRPTAEHLHSRIEEIWKKVPVK